MDKFCNYFDSPIGKLTVEANSDFITNIYFGERPQSTAFTKTDLIDSAVKQLNEYFQGKLQKFDLPIKPHGTEFQKKVWDALLTIPYGKTISYKQLAALIGNEKACRAVGNANNKNPIPIIIPCHRVIGTSGKLVGYALGLDVKKALLELEK